MLYLCLWPCVLLLWKILFVLRVAVLVGFVLEYTFLKSLKNSPKLGGRQIPEINVK